MDLTGPGYLAGPLRFFSLNAIDVRLNRCAVEPLTSRAAQSILDAVWAVWTRLGMPDNLQVDNEMSFFGSPIHPRGLGPLIRLCLHSGVALWFIPPAEPWRNKGAGPPKAGPPSLGLRRLSPLPEGRNLGRDGVSGSHSRRRCALNQ